MSNEPEVTDAAPVEGTDVQAEDTSESTEATESTEQPTSALAEVALTGTKYELSDLNLPEGIDEAVSEKIVNFVNDLGIDEAKAKELSGLFDVGTKESFEQQRIEAYSKEESELKAELDKLENKAEILEGAKSALSTMPESVQGKILNSLLGSDPSFLQWLQDVSTNNAQLSKYKSEHELVLGSKSSGESDPRLKMFPSMKQFV
jgi:hypothetical protein